MQPFERGTPTIVDHTWPSPRFLCPHYECTFDGPISNSRGIVTYSVSCLSWYSHLDDWRHLRWIKPKAECCAASGGTVFGARYVVFSTYAEMKRGINTPGAFQVEELMRTYTLKILSLLNHAKHDSTSQECRNHGYWCETTTTSAQIVLAGISKCI